MADTNIVRLQSVKFADTVQSMISRSCIIDFGIVKEAEPTVPKGIVTVEVSAATSTRDIKIMTCVLASFAGSNLTTNIVPTVGDKVLVVYPRRFDNDMFDTKKDEVIVNENSQGYNLLGGIAILLNQYRKNEHLQFFEAAKTGTTLRLAYSEEEKDNFLIVTTDENGYINFKCHKNTASLTAEGFKASLAWNEDDSENKLTLVTDEEANIHIKANGNRKDLTAEGLSIGLAYDADNEENKLTFDSDESANVHIKANYNFLDLTEEGLSVKLAGTEDENKLIFTSNEDAELSITSNDNSVTLDKDGALTVTAAAGNCTVEINKDGELNIASNDVTIAVAKDGSVTITNKAEVTIDSSGNVSIDAKSGKLSLKNSVGSLFDILDGAFQILNSSLMTAGSPASHTVVPQQFAQQATMLKQVMQ